nr:hypothetical protein [Tanacetum cinerariifolium]
IAASGTIPAAQKAWAAAQPDGEFDGIIASMISATNAQAGGGVVKSVTSTAVVNTNIVTEYAKIYNALDDAELEEGNVRIFSPLADFKIIQNANLDQSFRDKFVVSGQGKDATVTFLNVPVEFVPTGGPRFAGKAGEDGDFIHATDLTSDATTFVVDKVNNYSDDLFFKMVATADTTVLNSAKKAFHFFTMSLTKEQLETKLSTAEAERNDYKAKYEAAESERSAAVAERDELKLAHDAALTEVPLFDDPYAALG